MGREFKPSLAAAMNAKTWHVFSLYIYEPEIHSQEICLYKRLRSSSAHLVWLVLQGASGNSCKAATARRCCVAVSKAPEMTKNPVS